jgi:hypothetical protein
MTHWNGRLSPSDEIDERDLDREMVDKVIYLADAMLCCCATLGFLILCLKSTKGRGGRQTAKSDDIRRPI